MEDISVNSPFCVLVSVLSLAILRMPHYQKTCLLIQLGIILELKINLGIKLFSGSKKDADLSMHNPSFGTRRSATRYVGW